ELGGVIAGNNRCARFELKPRGANAAALSPDRKTHGLDGLVRFRIDDGSRDLKSEQSVAIGRRRAADSSAWVRYSIIQGIGGGHPIREVSLRAVRPFDSDSDVIVENERLVRAENRDDVIKLVPNVIDPTNLRSRNGGLLRAILYAADSVILQIRN